MTSPTDTQEYEPMDVLIKRDNAQVDALIAQLQADFESMDLPFEEEGIEPTGFALIEE